MALFTATTAGIRSFGRTVAGKMSGFAASSAFDAFGRTWFRAISSLVAWLLAVTTGIAVLARVRTIAKTVALLFTIGARDLHLFPLNWLLGATLAGVTKFYQCVSSEKLE